MFKKIRISVAVLFMTSNAAWANLMVPYFGGEVGYDMGKWKIKDVASSKSTANANGVFGGLFAGLRWNLASHFIVNTEIFGNESSTSTSNRTINITGGGTSQAKLRMKYSYGGSLLPGFRFNNAGMIYLRAGIIRSQFDLHQSIPPAGAGSVWSKNNVAGGQFGVGVQGDLDGAWGARAEYDYVTYNSFTAFGNTITARDNQFKIGVLYNFC
ncbi:MAG TPA: outer membrane beta-barrel protein [Gammaproteobacteria bacterium]|nr:outer membrane beta-barrel protein [Gammaproteobacteria bacterium]